VQVYDLFRRDGSEYRARMQPIQQIHYNAEEALAFLTLPATLSADAGYGLHPALLDGAFQAVTGLISESELRTRAPFLPFTLGKAVLYDALPEQAWAYVRQRTAPGDGYKRYDIQIADPDGWVVLAIADFTVRPLDAATQTREPLPAGAAPAPANVSPPTVAGQTDVYARFEDELTKCVAELTRLPTTKIRLDDDLSEYGFSSVTFVEFSNLLNERFGFDVMPTLFFEHSNLASVAAHLFEQHEPLLQQRYAAAVENVAAQPAKIDAVAERKVTLPFAAVVSTDGAEPIAIIGFAGRMPHSGDSLDTFWAHLEAGHDLVGELPAARLDAFGYSGQGLPPVRQIGYLDDIARFDAEFFRISPREAALMDPQQRILLETVWQAIEHAGYRASALAGGDVGVFIGVAGTDYYDVIKDRSDSLDAYAVTGAEHSIAANRLSFWFDFHGPSEPINTACSSSLVAIHRAAEALRGRNCELAIAGGINVFSSAALFHALSDAGMLAPDGRCKTFDKRADGYGRGEGAGVLVLKPLATALADGDYIHGVIRGGSLKHGGRASSLTAPNAAVQARLLVDAYRHAGIDPATVGYIEAHGTGTELGDPVEINALKQAFAQLLPAESEARIGLGAVKTNIGHLEAAAGVAGVLKVLLSFKHARLIGNIHLGEVNPYIRLDNSPFYLLRDNQPWPAPNAADGQPIPRRAGVSSFGFGGAYAHVVLEEYPTPPVAETAERAQVIVLSAPRRERLEAYVARWREFLAEAPAHALADVAFTLQTGRESMAARLAVVVSSFAELAETLEQFIRGEPGRWHYGELAEDGIENDDELNRQAATALRESDLSRLAELWTRGAVIDWTRLHSADGARRVPLPTYPFAGEPYWLAARASTPAHAATPTRTATQDCFWFQPVWRSAPLSQQDTSTLPEPILVLGDDEELEHRLLETLRRQEPQARVITLRPGSAYRRDSAERYTVQPTAADAWRELCDAWQAAGISPRTVVMLWPLTAAASAQREQVHALFHLLQGLLKQQNSRQTRLYYVHETGGDCEAADRAVAAFAKSVYQEQPALICKTLALDTALSVADRHAALWQELRSTAADWEIQYDPSGRRVRGYEAFTPPTETQSPLRQQGTYLITGGAGGLGLLVATHLAERYQARLVLLGRSAATAATEAALAKLRQAGAQVLYLQADVADAEKLSAALARIEQHFGTLHGVFHAAGIACDGWLLHKQPDEFAATLAPKVDGVLHLDRLLADKPLDFIALFSSLAAVHGNIGQADYAYANAFLDHFAAWRETLRMQGKRHGKTLAINWPWWQDGAMAPSLEQQQQLAEQFGLAPLSRQSGLAMLEQALAVEATQLAVVVGERDKLERYFSGTHPALQFSYVNDVAPTLSPVTGRESRQGAPLVDAAAGYLKTLIGEIIQTPAERLEAKVAFERYGVDSIAVHRFNARLQKALPDCRLPKTLLYEYRNIQELAEHLALSYTDAMTALLGEDATVDEAVGSPDTTVTPITPPPAPSIRAQDDAIAIIGLSGRYPQAPDLETFWRNLKSGRDCITETPIERWNPDHYPFSRWGGFLDEVDRFDPLFFNISPREAELMDPQERLFLQTVWACLENAGYSKQRLAQDQRQDTGVFVGVTTNTYEAIAAEAWSRGEFIKSNAYPWSIANRVSFFLDLSGPSLPVDTACSSSLTAIHLACASLRNNECRMAVAGGVNLYLHPAKYGGMSQMGMLSPGGRCRAFGAGADGFVPGEGVGAVLLKPLAAAIADGDRIHGLIRATALNHGGHANGYTVPNPNAQGQLIATALNQAGFDASTLRYIEAHGTGTLLGDPIEIAGLTKAFRAHTEAVQCCPIGSVKTNIGHLEAAAGIAALTKVLLQLRHRQLAPSLHAAELNPNIDFATSPFYVVRELQPWDRADDDSTPLRAGVSSFGAGGANAHVIVEEYRQPAATVTYPPPFLLILSARTEERLRVYAERLLSFLEAEDGVDMAALAYTLQTGREALDERLAMTVASQAECMANLRALLENRIDSKAIYRGSIKAGADSALLLDDQAGEAYIRAVLAERKLDTLAKLWVNGAALDWHFLYDAGRPRCLELPTYPFETRRCWLNVTTTTPAEPRLAVADANRSVEPPAPSGPAAPKPANPAEVSARVRAIVAETLLTAIDEIEPQAEFNEYGVDSLLTVEIIKRINRAFGLALKPTAVYSYPSVAALAGFILDEHGDALTLVETDVGDVKRSAPAPTVTAVEARPALADAPGIAIIGLSGRFPDADDAQQFWDNLKAGRNAIREVPAERWNAQEFYDPDPARKNKTYCKRGAFLDDVELFDPLFFSISPKEARLTDPQQRLFLEESWKALEDAGYAGDALDGLRCGVFVGAAQGDYDTLGETELKTRPELNAYSMVGPIASMLAARVSHFLNLNGPSMAVDTTCSSSLVALHMACQSLQTGESEMAIAGGVYCRFTPLLYLLASRAGALSPDGQCKAFDNDADGFGIGEAVAALVLKPLARAQADGDQIYGVIRASGVNHDGRTNGILAPNGKAQTALELDVYQRGGIDPATIEYVEAHATGTKLGDPIEVEALTQAFRRYTERKQFCAIGTAKSNIGHCVTASGVVGLTKVLLAFRHEQLPPSLLCRQENEHIDFANSPFFVNKTLRPWPRSAERVRRAAVSSFGFSGANCHIVVDESPLVIRAEVPKTPCYLATLSAQTPAALQERVRQLRQWLQEHAAEYPIGDICHTLNRGRAHFRYRAALVVDSPEELEQALDALALRLAEAPPRPASLDSDQVSLRQADLLTELRRATPLQYRDKLRELAELYEQGAALDWARLYASGDYRRISLPTYPFARERYWKPALKPVPVAAEPSASVSTATPPFSRRIDRQDALVCEHTVQGQSVLPGVAHLDMIFATAAELAGAGRAWAIEDLVWLQPVTVAAAAQEIQVNTAARTDGGFDFELRARTDSDEWRICSRGRLQPAPAAPAMIDLAAIRQRCGERIDAAQVYDAMHRAGVRHGAYFQSLQAVWRGLGATGNAEALGELTLPPAARHDQDRFVLHPALADGALQTLAALLLPTDGQPSPARLPFALARARLIRSLPNDSCVHIQQRGAQRFDIALCDRQGQVCLLLEDLELREFADTVAPLCFAPRWSLQPASAEPTDAVRDAGQSIIVIHNGTAPKLTESLRRAHRADAVLDIQLGIRTQALGAGRWEIATASTTAEHGFEQCLATLSTVDRIYYLGVAPLSTDILTTETLTWTQDTGVFGLLHLVHALTRAGLAAGRLRLDVVTNAVYAVAASDPVMPGFGSLHGLTMSLAREYVHWDCCHVDIELPATAVDADAVTAALQAEPAGNLLEQVVAWRAGQRFVRKLEPAPLPAAVAPFRQQGVYLILGGAGGIGLELAHHLARTVQARLVLIGRSTPTPDLRERIDAIEAAGGQVLYLTADAADAASLQAAVMKAKERFGVIHGAIHSALVLRDQSVAKLDAATLNEALAPKVAGSVNLYNAIQNEPLDFLLFFSSTNGLAGNLGQAGYAAACAFKDAFARHLEHRTAYPVRVINWGFWGSVGAVSSPEFRQRLEKRGLYSIENAEGIDAMQRVLASSREQVLVIRAADSVLKEIGVANAAAARSAWTPTLALLQEYLQRTAKPVDPLYAEHFQAVERFGRRLLLAAFQRMGALTRAGERYGKADLMTRLNYQPQHARLYHALLDILARAGAIRLTDDSVEATAAVTELDPSEAALAQEKHALAQRYPPMTAYIEFLWTCVIRYPEILTGTVAATDVVFPDSSIDLVENIYRDNEQADYYNRLTAAAVRAYVQSRLADLAPGERLQLIEIGAGTGGTSAFILERLAEFGDRLRYVYTDISKAFTLHGRRRFGTRYPFVDFKPLDVAGAVTAQGVNLGDYDVAIAVNVLHATRNMTATLGNVRALLKPGGVLALSEATSLLDMVTLTFGVLDGWWLFDDGDIRIPHSPLLTTPNWLRTLEQVGFGQTAVLRRTDETEAFHSVILAENAPAAAMIARPVEQPAAVVETVASPSTSAAVANNTQPADAIRVAISQCVADVLEIDAVNLDPELAFTDFGIDSILAVEVVRRLNDTLNITLRATELFNFATIDALTQHIARLEQAPSLPSMPAANNGNGFAATPTVAANNGNGDAAARIRASIQAALAEVLEISDGDFETDTPFTDFGIDSILAVDVINRINRALHIRLRATDLFNFPTIDQLTAHALAEFSQDLAAVAQPAQVTAPPAANDAAFIDLFRRLSQGELDVAAAAAQLAELEAAAAQPAAQAAAQG